MLRGSHRQPRRSVSAPESRVAEVCGERRGPGLPKVGGQPWYSLEVMLQGTYNILPKVCKGPNGVTATHTEEVTERVTLRERYLVSEGMGYGGAKEDTYDSDGRIMAILACRAREEEHMLGDTAQGHKLMVSPGRGSYMPI